MEKLLKLESGAISRKSSVTSACASLQVYCEHTQERHSCGPEPPLRGRELINQQPCPRLLPRTEKVATRRLPAAFPGFLLAGRALGPEEALNCLILKGRKANSMGQGPEESGFREKRFLSLQTSWVKQETKLGQFQRSYGKTVRQAVPVIAGRVGPTLCPFLFSFLMEDSEAIPLSSEEHRPPTLGASRAQ